MAADWREKAGNMNCVGSLEIECKCETLANVGLTMFQSNVDNFVELVPSHVEMRALEKRLKGWYLDIVRTGSPLIDTIACGVDATVTWKQQSFKK